MISSPSIPPHGQGKNYHDATPEELQALPARIMITTSELRGGGDSKTYWVRGLTFATAPTLLEEILTAAAAFDPAK